MCAELLGGSCRELVAFEGLSEAPVVGCDIVCGEDPAIPRGEAERERLAREHSIALPILAPIAGHRDPPGPAPLHLGRHHVPAPAHIGEQDKVEIRVPVHGEAHAPFLLARHAAVPDGHDPALVPRNL